MSNIYSQGVASDGPVILCDGLPITADMIVETLNRFVQRIKELKAENITLQRLDKAITEKYNSMRIERNKYKEAIAQTIVLVRKVHPDE